MQPRSARCGVVMLVSTKGETKMKPEPAKDDSLAMVMRDLDRLEKQAV